MTYKQIFDKESYILDYIRNGIKCKIVIYNINISSDNNLIEINYNYHYIIYYDINTRELNRIYYGYCIKEDNLTEDFNKYQIKVKRKTKLEKLNKIL